MEIDNIIYIVITISIFIVSLLGQIKRKKPPGPVATDEVIYSLNDFEKILERKEEFKKIEEQDSNLEEFTSTEHTDHDLKQEKGDLEEKNEHKTEEKEIEDGFDIKSAIIYSSILERKKFRR